MGAKHTPRRGPLSQAQRLAILATAAVCAFLVTRPSSSSSDHPWRLLGEAGGGWGGGGAAGGGAAAAAAAAAAATELTQELLSKLEDRPACIASATSSPVPVHGWVNKAGPLPMRLLDGPATKARHHAYFAWRDRWNVTEQTREFVVDGQPERVGVAPPLFPYCRILVNHRYRTLYLKAPKTGSTSLLTLLGTCTGGRSDKPTCFEPLQPMASQAAYNQMYADYFVWTVVRNPWARAVSSYRMLSRYMKRECKGLVGGWDKVCANVNHMPFTHNLHPECTITKVQGEGFAMHHFIPQAPCLETANGEWAADYVVRTEKLQEDMREVLREMNARRKADAPALDVDGILGQLTNVNRVHVACHGSLPAPKAHTEGGSGGGLPAGISAVGGQRRALAGKPTWLEAPESYCSEAMYFLEHHSHCFDSLRAYYEADMRLFGLPTCEDE